MSCIEIQALEFPIHGDYNPSVFFVQDPGALFVHLIVDSESGLEHVTASFCGRNLVGEKEQLTVDLVADFSREAQDPDGF